MSGEEEDPDSGERIDDVPRAEELFDPVSFSAKLAEARGRRARALGEKTLGAEAEAAPSSPDSLSLPEVRAAPEPAPVREAAALLPARRAPAFLAGLVVGLTAAALAAALLRTVPLPGPETAARAGEAQEVRPVEPGALTVASRVGPLGSTPPHISLGPPAPQPAVAAWAAPGWPRPISAPAAPMGPARAAMPDAPPDREALRRAEPQVAVIRPRPRPDGLAAPVPIPARAAARLARTPVASSRNAPAAGLPQTIDQFLLEIATATGIRPFDVGAADRPASVFKDMYRVSSRKAKDGPARASSSRRNGGKAAKPSGKSRKAAAPGRKSKNRAGADRPGRKSAGGQGRKSARDGGKSGQKANPRGGSREKSARSKGRSSDRGSQGRSRSRDD